MNWELATLLAVLAALFVGVAHLRAAAPQPIDKGSLDTRTDAYWRRLARHERGTR